MTKVGCLNGGLEWKKVKKILYERLEKSNMPYHTEVKGFAEQLLKHLPDYYLKDEKKESRVVLLTRKL